MIFGTPDDLKNIMVVGHNPSMHEITEYLANKLINKYPTCCLAALTIDSSWNEISQGCEKLEFIKNLASFVRR